MTRKYIKISTRRTYDPEKILHAIQLVKFKGRTIREAARESDLSFTTLMYHLKKFNEQSINNYNSLPVGYKRDRKTFNDQQEEQLKEYMCSLSTVFIGLQQRNFRYLAYEWAILNNIVVPKVWITSECAGTDWAINFIKRHKVLLYDPDNSSKLTSISDYKAEKSEIFFDKFAAIVRAHNLKPQNVWNMDQMGICTNNHPARVILRRELTSDDDGNNGIREGESRAEKSIRTVRKPVKLETGEIVITIFTVSATGNTVPPVFIFPRKALNRKSLENSPEGSLGLCNCTGWMNSDHFLEYLKHFVSKTRSSKEKKHLLLVDNWSSPVTLKSLEYARENGIIMLSFPARSVITLQPLDRTIFEIIKKFINSACDKWTEFHKGQKMSVDNIPSIVSSIYSAVFSPSNIQNGYRMCGIYPFDRDVNAKVKQNPKNFDLESDNSDESSDFKDEA